MANLARFDAELKKIGEEITPELARKMTIVTVGTLHGKIVRKTRVDTGNARANWNVNVGEADNSVTTIEKPGIGAAAALSQASAKLGRMRFPKPYEKVTISNNVEYILTLEHGSPSFGPGDAMVSSSLAEFAIEHPILFSKITFTNFNAPFSP